MRTVERSGFYDSYGGEGTKLEPYCRPSPGLAIFTHGNGRCGIETAGPTNKNLSSLSSLSAISYTSLFCRNTSVQAIWNTWFALKSVKQNYRPTREALELLQIFRLMVNDCIMIGLESGTTSMKRLSILSYGKLKRYGGFSGYRLNAISKAAGIIAARKKSIRRGYPTKTPVLSRPHLVSSYGFKVEDGKLRFPLKTGEFQFISLTPHTLQVLSEPNLRIRSFTLSETSLSLCIAKQVSEIECEGTVGVDRNLRNLTVGNERRAVQYGLSKALKIAETTTRIIGSFKRDDVKVRRRLASKYGRRRRCRTQYLLHNITKQVVTEAFARREAIVLENIEGIRRLYRRGNGQGRIYRRRMNGWSFGEAQRQIEYKARWVGLPVIRLSKSETRGTSVLCPQCGERLQEDRQLRRKLWCAKCRTMTDRDVVAAVNLSRRGRLKFDRSRAHEGPQDGAVEAVKGNPTTTVVLRVDAPKPSQPKT